MAKSIKPSSAKPTHPISQKKTTAKAKQLSKNDLKSMDGTTQVDHYFNLLVHPLKAEMMELRSIIMNANRKISEHIKWGAPSFFCEGGNDKGGMATFNPRQEKFVHLVFHNAAILNDRYGLLEGEYVDRRMAYFNNMEDVKLKKAILEKIVNDWVATINK